MVHCATTTEGSKGMLFTRTSAPAPLQLVRVWHRNRFGMGNCSACAFVAAVSIHWLSVCGCGTGIDWGKGSCSACALGCCQRSLAVLLGAPPMAGDNLAHVGGVDVGASRCRNCIVGLQDTQRVDPSVAVFQRPSYVTRRVPSLDSSALVLGVARFAVQGAYTQTADEDPEQKSP